jgi:uncharacterized phage-associated protein
LLLSHFSKANWSDEMAQVTAFDVAKYILDVKGAMSAMKLQKLVYYSQAWSLVWDDEPLFDNRIEAWSNGPVVRDLYDAHKGLFKVNSLTFAGDTGALSANQKDSIGIVLRSYGDRSAQWLSAQTHSEPPWIDARAGLSDNERGDCEITLASMSEYYSAL